MPRNCHFVNAHHAYPEGLLLVERENRESLLLIGARNRPRKKTGVKGDAQEEEVKRGKEMGGVGDVRGRAGDRVFRSRS